MRVVELSGASSEQVERYESVGTRSLRLAHGSGEAHAYLLHFEPGGRIGEHLAGFGQLFLVLEGEGWVSGDDGTRRDLAVGQAAFFQRGERHAKGSESGMTALMVQVRDLAPAG